MGAESPSGRALPLRCGLFRRTIVPVVFHPEGVNDQPKGVNPHQSEGVNFHPEVNFQQEGVNPHQSEDGVIPHKSDGVSFQSEGVNSPSVPRTTS
jgi:hypothetical protein